MLGNKVVMWGVRNLYSVDTTDSARVFSQYPSVRVRDYVAKMLIQFMNNEQIFRSNTEDRRRQLKTKINAFLRRHSGSGDKMMLENGECVSVRSRETGVVTRMTASSTLTSN